MGLKTGQKKGINIYYDYRKTVFELLTDKQLRNVIYCLLDLDEHGEITENKKSYEEIQKDNTAKIVFDILKTNNERASAAWHRINKAKHPELYQDETENEYLPSETIKNDLRGTSDNERGVEIIIDRVKETDEEHKTLMTEKGRVINYDPENEDFCELGYYVIEKTKLKLMVDNNELISFQELK